MYYADDVVMQENSDAPFVGKVLNRNREIEFFQSIAEWHGAKVEYSAINGDVSFGQWWMDVTFKNGSGTRTPKWRCGNGRTARLSTSGSFITRLHKSR